MGLAGTPFSPFSYSMAALTVQMQFLADGGLLCSHRTSATEAPQPCHTIYSSASQLLRYLTERVFNIKL